MKFEKILFVEKPLIYIGGSYARVLQIDDVKLSRFFTSISVKAGKSVEGNFHCFIDNGSMSIDFLDFSERNEISFQKILQNNDV